MGYFVTDTAPSSIETVTFTKVEKTNNFSVNITKDYLGNDLIYNKQYYVYVKDEVGNIAGTEVTSKIDKILPKLEISAISATTNSITISVNANDEETGLNRKI